MQVPTLPSTMRAVICDGHGAPDVMHLESIALPAIQDDEVLIKVAFAGLNRADLMQREGKYPPPPDASPILGMEVSGVIAATGAKVTDWKAGDRVAALLASGGYAEYVAVPAAHILPVPDHISLRDAAALPEAIVTVWANLIEGGGLKAGETCLLHGGASGIGHIGIQIARLLGARSIVTVGDDTRAEFCQSLGAEAAINYNKEDFVSAVIEATKGRGIDVALDMVGGDYISRTMATLAMGGRLVSIATQKGREAMVDIRLLMAKRLTLTGSTLRGRDRAEKARLIAEIRAKIWPFVENSRLRPHIQASFPLNLVAEAHKMMESGVHLGKIVLEVA